MGTTSSKPNLCYSVVREESEEAGYSPIFTNKIKSSSDSIPLQNKVLTLFESFYKAFINYHNNPYIGTRIVNPDGTLGKFFFKTYEQVFSLAEKISFGLSSFKLNNEDLKLLGIFSKNREEWLIIEQACLFQNITTVAIPENLCTESLVYIINQCKLAVICCSKSQFEVLMSVKDLIPCVRTLILFDKLKRFLTKEANEAGIEIFDYEDLPNLKSSADHSYPTPESIVTISYTSGTTGHPKGALISHSNIVSTLAGAELTGLEVTSKDSYLMYLPHSHIFDKIFFYGLTNSGCSIGIFSGDMNKIRDDLCELKPTIFVSVPRLLNKLYEGINQKINEISGFKKNFLKKYLSQKYKNYEKTGDLRNSFIMKFGFKKVENTLGGRVRLIISGSAPISCEILKFLRIMYSCPIIEGYGLTETCGGSFICHPLDTSVGHVGGPIPGVEVRLREIPELNYTVSESSQAGELLIRGAGVFKGYYKSENVAFDSEGWFHTGDILQRSSRDGSFKVLDRIKNIVKLSQGEYVSLEKIENVCTQSNLVSQIFVHADPLEDHLVAVVVPNKKYIEENWQRSHKSLEWEETCKIEKLKIDILEDFKSLALKHSLKSFEIIRNIHLEPYEWTENDLLTSTQKLIRHKAVARYHDVIVSLHFVKEFMNYFN